jgi:flagellar biosynthesis/type III secretory pathway protein FliH
MREIERNLVKLVVSITQKVVDVSLKPSDHEKIIFEALDEVKKSKSRL